MSIALKTLETLETKIQELQYNCKTPTFALMNPETFFKIEEQYAMERQHNLIDKSNSIITMKIMNVIINIYRSYDIKPGDVILV